MYFVYIIKSLKYNRYYIGFTENLNERLRRHNKGDVKSTKFYGPWELVYFEKFDNKKDARKREIFLKKTAKAREEIFEKIDKAPSSSLV